MLVEAALNRACLLLEGIHQSARGIVHLNLVAAVACNNESSIASNNLVGCRCGAAYAGACRQRYRDALLLDRTQVGVVGKHSVVVCGARCEALDKTRCNVANVKVGIALERKLLLVAAIVDNHVV